MHFEYIPTGGIHGLDPLKEIFTTYNDPQSQSVDPALGPLFIKQPSNSNSYQSYSQHPYLFGKVEVVREITDEMGAYSTLTSAVGLTQADLDAWTVGTLTNVRFHGHKAAPHLIKFGLKDYNNNF